MHDISFAKKISVATLPPFHSFGECNVMGLSIKEAPQFSTVVWDAFHSAFFMCTSTPFHSFAPALHLHPPHRFTLEKRNHGPLHCRGPQVVHRIICIQDASEVKTYGARECTRVYVYRCASSATLIFSVLLLYNTTCIASCASEMQLRGTFQRCTWKSCKKPFHFLRSETVCTLRCMLVKRCAVKYVVSLLCNVFAS